MDQAVAAVRRAWEKEDACQVVTANAEMLYTSLQDRELARILEEAELVTADGAGVLLAARISGASLPERVAGFDLMLACLQEAARAGVPVFFLGSSAAVLEQALLRLHESYPGLNIAGSHHGYFSDGEGEAIVAQILARRPRLLLWPSVRPARRNGSIAIKICSPPVLPSVWGAAWTCSRARPAVHHAGCSGPVWSGFTASCTSLPVCAACLLFPFSC
jgi:hypothetical protein